MPIVTRIKGHAALLLAVPAVAGCMQTGAGSPSTHIPVGTAKFDVRAYGARADGATNDTAAFTRAIGAAAKAGKPKAAAIVWVPKGHYAIDAVTLQSNVVIQVEAGSVLTMASSGTGNDALFELASTANGGASFIRNVGVEGVGGRFTIDLSNPPSPRNHAVSVLNARHFLLAAFDVIQNDSQPSGAPPTSQSAALTFASNRASVPGGTLYHPMDGVIRDISVTHAPYSYGATQVTSGQNLRFSNLSSTGGIALRMETDRATAGRLGGVSGDHISCDHGHAAVSFSPHDQNNYNVHITDIRAVSCAQAVRLGGATLTGSGGRFINASVTGGTVVFGPGAQIPDPGGDWKIGRSQDCVSRSSTANYTVRVTGLSCP